MCYAVNLHAINRGVSDVRKCLEDLTADKNDHIVTRSRIYGSKYFEVPKLRQTDKATMTTAAVRSAAHKVERIPSKSP